MDIGAWLRNLGLGRYEVAFRDNSIDLDVLPDLTESDLAQLGMPLGDRKRLLKAIANPPLPPAAPMPPPPAPASPQRPRDDAERRPITVMFCDLVDSTSLAAKLDPEDWRELVGAYLDEASQAVAAFGGHVLKKLGDGLMALFGYPKAQENDAERAARAALAILRALDRLNARNAGKGLPPLTARIGLESGPVVVDATGEVFGEAPNVAARVQSVAEPGTALVTGAVQRQIAGLFVVEDKGPHELKGVTGKRTLYHLVRTSGAGRRIGARSLTPLVGREEELALLTRRFERARGGQGQFVQIVGEPGLGKSRLMEEFRQKIVETPHTWVEWTASQLLQNTPLHPLAEWGRQRFDGVGDRLAELEAALAQVELAPGENAPLLALLLDIPLPEARAPTLLPEELRRKQLEAVVAWTLASARTQPLVLAFEDLHWADPSSLDLMKTLAERGAAAPLFILATARPEFRARWATRSHHGVVSLVPLDRGQIREMVASIAERHALSREVVEGLSERTAGVPLFVEEVTRLLLERGETEGGREIPPTLQQSLAARLDRLGDAREVAQIGAVLGREFSYSLLRAVAGLPEPALGAALEQLADADLLLADGVGPETSYRFKHALIQDAAYESLLKGRRRALHQRAAEELVASRDPQPELVAHHFTQAGETDQAIEWWGKAGDAALRRSAFQEAISHLGKAIDMADQEDSGKAATASRRRVELQRDYGQALMWVRGFEAQETEAAFKRLDEMAGPMRGRADRLAAFEGEWGRLYMRGELHAAEEAARAFLAQAERDEDTEATTLAWRRLGTTRFSQGYPAEAKRWLEQALSSLGQVRKREAPFSASIDDQAMATAWIALTSWMLGEVDAARALVQRAIAVAVEREHLPSIAIARFSDTVLECWRGDAAATLRAAEATAEVGKQAGMRWLDAIGGLYASWARGRLSNHRGGAAQLGTTVAAVVEGGHRNGAPLYSGLLADLDAFAGDFDAALAEIEKGLAIASETGERLADSFLYRVRGDVLLKADPSNSAPAETAYKRALAIAEEQGMRTYRLLAALSLARLYQSNGRLVDAHNVLASALEGFAPTPELPQIAEAQALLAALAESDAMKAEAARRERRAQLQLSMATALLQGRGMQTLETRAAFDQVDAIGAAANDPMEQLAILFGRWAGELARGDVRQMLEIAASMERVAAREPRGQGAVVARRVLGISQYYAGDLASADQNMQWAVDHYDFDRDRGLAIRFAHDPGVAARYYLAFAKWMLGDAEASSRLVAEAKSLADRLDHLPTTVALHTIVALLDCLRGDQTCARTNAEKAIALARDSDLQLWRVLAEFSLSWAKAASEGTRANWEAAEASLAAVLSTGAALLKVFAPYIAAGFADLGDFDRALVAVDRALSGPAERGVRVFLPEAHRVHGEILFKRNPGDPAPAEQSLLTAISIALEQGSRSVGLRAALSLAKLYQSTGRPFEGFTALATALDGFSPTPEMPEIAEAQALLAALAETNEVKAEGIVRRISTPDFRAIIRL